MVAKKKAKPSAKRTVKARATKRAPKRAAKRAPARKAVKHAPKRKAVKAAPAKAKKLAPRAVRAVPKPITQPEVAPGPQVGRVTDYLDHISVVIIKVMDTIKVGDRLQFRGETGPVEQVVNSMQVEHRQVQVAKAGDDIGMKVDNPVKRGAVYKL